MQHVSIGEASIILGVSITTLRRWDKSEYLVPKYRTNGGHRRYDMQDIYNITNHTSQVVDKTICYARVSTHGQKTDLERQAVRLEQYCIKNNYNYEVIKDLGSGLNYNKKGLLKLLHLISTKQISRLLLTHKDRLLRFGSQIVINLCNLFNIEVIILDDTILDQNESLAQDVIEIITVFSARLYGQRSHKNKKLIDIENVILYK